MEQIKVSSNNSAICFHVKELAQDRVHSASLRSLFYANNNKFYPLEWADGFYVLLKWVGGFCVIDNKSFFECVHIQEGQDVTILALICHIDVYMHSMCIW